MTRQQLFCMFVALSATMMWTIDTPKPSKEFKRSEDFSKSSVYDLGRIDSVAQEAGGGAMAK